MSNFVPDNRDFSNVQKAYTYDDMLLVPSKSDISSRKDTDISQDIWDMHLETPIIPANMSTICGVKMVDKVCSLGGTAAIHRFMSPEQYISYYSSLSDDCQDRAGISIGFNMDWNREVIKGIIKLGMEFCPVYAMIDVAHGHHSKTLSTIYDLRSEFPVFFDLHSNCRMILGNICTSESVKYFISAENSDPKFTAQGYKVGIGAGAVCSTRKVTGCGYPQLSAIKSVAYTAANLSEGKIVIADGGIRDSGDIVKSIAAGAHLVMMGGVFAGTEETPGEERKRFSNENPTVIKRFKTYAGMASKTEHEKFFGKTFHAPEGVEREVEVQGPVEDVFKRLNWGIRSGLSYCGCWSLDELRQYGDLSSSWVNITTAGSNESEPHFKR